MPFQFGFSFFYSLMLCLLAHFYDFPDSTSISMMLSVNFSVFFLSPSWTFCLVPGKIERMGKKLSPKGCFYFYFLFLWGSVWISGSARGRGGKMLELV